MEVNEKRLLETFSIMSPKTVPVGTSVLLIDVDEAGKFFPDHTHNQLLRIFENLAIPLIHDRSRVSFNLYTLERVLYYLTKPGGKGIALGGSDYRNSTRYRRRQLNKEDNVLTKITDKEVEEIYSAKMETERLASGQKASTAARQAYISLLRDKKNKKNNGEEETGTQ